jgi:hypothetical protein
VVEGAPADPVLGPEYDEGFTARQAQVAGGLKARQPGPYDAYIHYVAVFIARL